MAHPNRRLWTQEIWIENGVGVMLLQHPDGRGGTHYFDVDLYGDIIKYHWHEYAQGYASARVGRPEISLHRWIMGLSNSDRRYVDHIDRNCRNSVRENMRIVTSRGNALNRAGISEHPNITHNKWGWLLHVKYKGKQPFSPTFKSLDQALECRKYYLEIAHALDDGLRDVPTKAELKEIANAIRY